MQIKSFTTWVNLHLAKVGMEVADLKTDFADGLRLIKLVEVISEEQLGKYTKKPISKFQKVENLNVALNYINGFLQTQGISNQYSAENILEENEVLILGMVWSLILRFSVMDISEGDRTAKEGLLLWAQKKVDEGSKGKIAVNNFHTSWQDGMAFLSLINAFRPDIIDYASCKKSSDMNVKMQNLNMAFEAAEKHLGIPKMLDAQDMVAARPDEKSVMTYITFFWKCFASGKKRKIAAEQIASVVAREQQFVELQSQYDTRMAALISWIETMHAKFAGGTASIEPGMLAQTLDAYVDYGANERPAKIQEMAALEALYHAINTRMASLNRSFVPPDERSLPNLQRWWEKLTLAEQAYEEGIKSSLRGVKKLGRLVKLFNSKAAKLETWIATKAAWLQASHDVATNELGKERVVVAAKRGSTAGDEKLADPTAAEVAPLPGSPGALKTTPSTEGGAKEEGEGEGQSALEKAKRPSFFGDLFAAITDNFNKPEDDEAGAEEGVASLSLDDRLRDSAASPTSSKKEGSGFGSPMMRNRRSLVKYQEEFRQETNRMSEGGSDLHSVSAVLAKINLFKAYEEEQANRTLSLGTLKKLAQELRTLACPVIDSIEKRCADVTEGVEALAAAAVKYRADLDEALAKHKQLDEKRLDFAKRAEALNRWTEESIDHMSDSVEFDTMEEADAAEKETVAFKTDMADKRAEGVLLEKLQEEMDAEGAGINPYSRFRVEEIETALAAAEAAAEERTVAIASARTRISDLDAQKKQFAALAEDVIALVKKEKTSLEERTRGVNIHPDDAESIVKGKEQLAYLTEYASKAAERAEGLAPAKAVSDALMAAAEMDNPYTRQSMASLNAAVDQLEKLVRDAMNLVEGQLARAQASISPEQHAELAEAFKHFDKTNDGHLNILEFGAAMKSLDFDAETTDAEFVKFAKPEQVKGADGEEKTEDCIDFDAFLTIVLQQYKSKDTMDGLIAAFKSLSNGKDVVQPRDLTETLKKPDAEFLQARLVAGAEGLDYVPFSQAVYGQGTVPLS